MEPDEVKASAGEWIAWVVRHADDGRALYQVEQDVAAGKITLWEALPVVWEIVKRLAADFPLSHESHSVPALMASCQADGGAAIVGLDGKWLSILEKLLPIILSLLGGK